MISRELQAELINIVGEEAVEADVPMSAHCSFRTGGPADLLVRAGTGDQLDRILARIREAGADMFLLGRGTNLLVGDGGYRGVIVTMTGAGALSLTDTTDAGEEPGGAPLNGISVSGTRLRAGAGASLQQAAMAAMEAGLSGLEFAAGIPGSVGGGIVMNAGAYNGEMKDVVESVRLTHLKDPARSRVFAGSEMEFGYRTSLLRKESYAATEAVFALTPDDPERIRERIRDLAVRRRDKQPLEYPSAGSTFKRPRGNFAGKLIMEAGLAGYRVGGAQVSEKHCGFVINRGGASSADVMAVISHVRDRVLEDTGILLEQEVICLGEF